MIPWKDFPRLNMNHHCVQDAVIVSAVRTPIGRFGGAFKDIPPADLGAAAMKAAMDRANAAGTDLDLFIFGNVLRGGHGQLVPRQAAIKAGIPDSVDGYAIDMVCASGMMSLMNARNMIATEQANLVLAGGFESMSQAGFGISHRARWGYKTLLGNDEPLVDLMQRDGLVDPVNGEGMGEESERVAREHEVTRAQLDEIAMNSQRRAADATKRGAFKHEIVGVEVRGKRGAESVQTDEGIRAETTLESLSQLKPAFRKDGVLTAGNSSQISDGAAAVLLASAAFAKQRGFKPIGRILGGSWAAGETWRFTQAPIPAVRRLLERLGKTITDFELFENNEAFALSSVLFHEQLGVPYEKLNVNGGAIALGHPIGASGARIIVTLLHALAERKERYGLAAICHGTGGSTALAIERL